jgi:hypothetical protein
VTNTAIGEQCDSGGRDTASCDSDYTLPRCGDGHKNAAAGEECDAAGESADCNINCKWSRCGDGIVNAHAGETCDDGNKDSCGTCNDDCSRVQRSEFAKGDIIVSLSDPPTLDGKWFSIADGQHAPLIFEFDKDHTPTTGHTMIYVTTSKSPSELAGLIRDAINGASDLNIDAMATQNIVRLENTQPGASGNQDMDQSPGTFAFTVDGMSGGASREGCTAGTGCRYDQDCKSGSCQSGRCQ